MTDTPHIRRAALWMLGAIVSFSSMAVAGRAAAVELDTFELMTYRSLLGVLIVLAAARLTGTLGRIRARRMGLHAARNVSHFVGQNLWFFAITAAPLAQVFALEFTTPIWVALAAPLLLNERLTAMRLGAAIAGFCGILIVARPDIGGIGAGQIAAASAAIGFAGSAIFTKLLTRSEAIVSILFWLTVMQSVFGLAIAGADGDIAVPSARLVPWLTLIAVAGLTAHFSLTKALTLAPAAVIMPIDFLRLPTIAVVGMLLYGETVAPGVFLGAAIIFAANYANILHETRPARVSPKRRTG